MSSDSEFQFDPSQDLFDSDTPALDQHHNNDINIIVISDSDSETVCSDQLSDSDVTLPPDSVYDQPHSPVFPRAKKKIKSLFVPGYPEWFNISYSDDEAIYSYKLMEDYKAKDLEIII